VHGAPIGGVQLLECEYVSGHQITDWEARRCAAHVLVQLSIAQRGGTHSKMLVSLLAWAREDESRAEAFALFGKLGCNRQRVRQVLVAACVQDPSTGFDWPGARERTVCMGGAAEAAAALAQIYSVRSRSPLTEITLRWHPLRLRFL
jgi:hypothetical protein